MNMHCMQLSSNEYIDNQYEYFKLYAYTCII